MKDVRISQGPIYELYLFDSKVLEPQLQWYGEIQTHQ